MRTTLAEHAPDPHGQDVDSDEPDRAHDDLRRRHKRHDEHEEDDDRRDDVRRLSR